MGLGIGAIMALMAASQARQLLLQALDKLPDYRLHTLLQKMAASHPSAQAEMLLGLSPSQQVSICVGLHFPIG